jgi:hypothetical protein
VLSELSVAIEEVRGVFKNVGESQNQRGIYPFEAIKTIHRAISDLGYGSEFSNDRARRARATIIPAWKKGRAQLLRELDRDFPTYPESPYLPTE